MPLRLMFSVAEVSADAHAARVTREIRRLVPGAVLFGAGGERMVAAGVDGRVDITDTSSVGLADMATATLQQVYVLIAVASSKLRNEIAAARDRMLSGYARVRPHLGGPGVAASVAIDVVTILGAPDNQ